MAGMNGAMHKAGQGIALGPELFMALNEVEQREKRASREGGGSSCSNKAQLWELRRARLGA